MRHRSVLSLLALGPLLASVLVTAACEGSPDKPLPTAPNVEVTIPQGTDAPSASTSSEPLLTETPDPYSAVGRIVDGFPAALTPALDQLQVLQTSAQPGQTAGTADISLNVRSTASADEVLTILTAPLLTAGFTQSSVVTDATVAHHVIMTRSSGAEVLVIVVIDADGTRTATMGGTVAVPTS